MSTPARSFPRWVRTGSEDLRAPGRMVGAEERVRTTETPLGELVDEAGSGELGEREAAQIDRGEVADVEGEIRRSRRPLGFAALELPASVVPGAEGVPDLEDERVLGRVRAGGERGADVDENAHLLSATLATPLGVEEEPVLPPLGRANEHARRLRGDAVVDAWERRESLGLVHETRLAEALERRTERSVSPLQPHRPAAGGGAVAEAAVDAGLGRPQNRGGLAAPGRVPQPGG